MLIFIDESGDAGFKTTRGSTEYFVISLVIFDDDLEAERTALAIKDYKLSLGKGDDYEFKFNRSDHKFRLSFLTAVKSCKFRVRSVVVEKSLIYSKYLRDNTKSFYNFILKQALEHNNSTIKDAKIRLDGLGERKFRQAMTTYLRKELNSKTKEKVMRNFRFRDSKSDILIQLADMIAGSIKRYYENGRPGNKDYREVISQRIEDEWVFN